MIKHLLVSTAFAGLVLSASGAANATPITVSNASFETLSASGLNFAACGPGCAYSVGLPIPGWATTGSDTGQFQPGSGGTYFNYVPDGITVAYTNGGTISQTLSATAIANATYQLSVDLGFRKDVLDPGLISLQIGAQTVLATGLPSQLSGDWVTYTALLTTTAADAGAAIKINLASGAPQGDFDNVRLDARGPAAVPEPLTMSVFGAGLAGLGILRRRRKAAKA